MPKYTSKCLSPYTYRKPHYRRSPSGGKIKIAGTCVKSPSSRTSVRKTKKSPITLRKGVLSRYGYASALPIRQRHRALDLAVSEEGWLPIFRRLNVLSIYNKNRNRSLSALFLADRNWIGNKYSD